MKDPNSRAVALARAAEAMLRTLGGGEITLRCPTAPAANAAGRELGLDAPAAEDISVAPVLVRRTGAADDGATFELLFAPSSLAEYVAERRQSPEEFLRAAFAIVYQGRTLRVRDVTTDTFAGGAYLYRVAACE